MLGDKMWSSVFDNSKVKRVVPDFVAPTPFVRGAEEIMAWFDADPEYKPAQTRQLMFYARFYQDPPLVEQS